MSDEYVSQAEGFLSEMRAILQTIKNTPQYKDYMTNYRLMIEKKILTREASSDNMFQYYINTVQIMDLMREAVLDLRSQSQAIIASEISKVNQEYVVGVFILVILFIISPMMIILVRNAVNALQLFSASVRVKARALKKEKRKAEGLITQMLPKTVAENLKQNKARFWKKKSFFRREMKLKCKPIFVHYFFPNLP